MRGWQLTVLIALISCSGLAAEARAQARGTPLPGEPVTPVRLLDNAQTRVVRVDILPNSTRSMHDHADMLWHVFVTMDAPIVLTIRGQAAPVRLEPWQTHFFKGGVVHAMTNPSARPVQFLEVFAKDPNAKNPSP